MLTIQATTATGSPLTVLEESLNGNPEAIRKELVTALNLTAVWGRKQVEAKVKKVVTIDKKGLAETMRIQRANPNRLFAVVVVEKKKRPSLKRFQAQQAKKGVTYKIDKRGKRKTVLGAFGPTMPRLGHHVFRRKGKNRFPIIKLFGPSVWGIVVKNDIDEAAQPEMADRLNHEITRRIRAVLVRQGKIAKRQKAAG